MLYLNKLVNSHTDKQNRQITDLIDKIHLDERGEIEADLKQVQMEIREQLRKDEEPVNFEVFVYNKLE